MDFVTWARLNGVLVEDGRSSDKIRRCGTADHPKSKNGSYWYDSGRGWIISWDNGGELQWYEDPNQAEPSAEQKAKWARQREELRRRQEAMWNVCARQCAEMLRSCRLGPHDYLHRKGLGDIKGHVTPDGELFVPMHNFRSDELIGYQTIFWDHDERKWVKL